MIATGRGQNLTYSIAEDLGVAIVTGTYSSKKPFPVEGELCRRYGVSRSILREAVKMLTAKGLLDSRPRRGTWVQDEGRWNLLDPDVLRWMLERKFSFSLLIEFSQVRLAIEPKAAALAAVAAGPAERAAIGAAIQAMIESERTHDDPLEPDIAFHVADPARQQERILFAPERTDGGCAALQHPHDQPPDRRAQRAGTQEGGRRDPCRRCKAR